MLVSEIEDCEECPLKEEGICAGGWTSGAGGTPIVPPCTSWNGNEDTEDIIANYYEREAYYAWLQEKEELKQRKKKESSAKSRYMQSVTRYHTKRINAIKKQIREVRSAKSSYENLSSALSIVNSMFSGKAAENTTVDTSSYDNSILRLNKELEVENAKLEEERKKVRSSKGYARTGLQRKPNYSYCKDELWSTSVIDYVSVKTDTLFKKVFSQMETYKITKFDSLLIMLKLKGIWHLYNFNGNNFEDLGFLETRRNRDESVFWDLLKSIDNDLREPIEVIVFPSCVEYCFFYSLYPSYCTRVVDFPKIWQNRMKGVKENKGTDYSGSLEELVKIIGN